MNVIKKVLLKLLGFDNDSIELLKTEIKNLKDTISVLKDECTEVNLKTETAFSIIKYLNINNEDELWWEKVEFGKTDDETYRIARGIQQRAMVNWVKNHKSLKVHKVLHGGCHECITPLKHGIGICLDCKYSECNWSLPSLRETKFD